MWRLLLALLVLIGAVDGAWCGTPIHAIAVLVHDDGRDTREQWTPTADYLASQIQGHAFVIVPLRWDPLSRAVARGDVEFAITDAGHYVELVVWYSAAAIATMQRWSGETPSSTAGATIITRADRSDIAWMSDLKGKSFMAVSRDSFNGFRLAWWELLAHEIDPFGDLSRLVFSGPPAEQVVHAVRDGAVDSAAVRTDVLERMRARGEIDLGTLRVLHPRSTDAQRVPRSTDLYPEWAFAATPAASDELRQRVAGALQAMPVRHSAALSADYAGWTAPLDYRPVHEVLRDLHVAPYENVADMTLVQLARRHSSWVVMTLGLIALMAATLVYVSRLNYRLYESKRALERARGAEAKLAHMGRLAAMGEMSTTLAHELNQPLAAIANYANGSIRRLHDSDLDKDDLLRVMQRIASEANRSAQIIRRLREFLRRRKPVHAPEDVNGIVREAVNLVRATARRKQVDVRVALTEALPRVVVDAVQIEQVVVNLVQNAIEAIDDAKWPRREVVVMTERNPRRGIDITVRDTGPGIPVEVESRLFQPFVSTKTEGMGLGLSISHSIVEAHGDRLRADVSAGGGAAFRFTLSETEEGL